MKYHLIFLMVLILFLTGSSEEHYFKIKLSDKEKISALTRKVSIDRIENGWIYAYANGPQWETILNEGYAPQKLPAPSTLFSVKMTDNIKAVTEWDAYPTFTAYVEMMQDFASSYPEICLLDTIGFSVNGRPLLVVKISDNVNSEEAEPEFFYTATMHGDETTGYVLLLRLIDYLLVNYNSSTDEGMRVTELVNNLEIWINPLANPDGTYASGDETVNGATRFNANSIDLNRNFPDPEDGDHPDGYSWQPETAAMMEFASAHSFVLSSNMHGGAEIVNYPWDTWEQRHADDLWWQDVCTTYAETAQNNSPGSYMRDGIINGYDWYEVNGGRQDYMNYFRHCREMTLEISNTKLPPEEDLPDYWDYNKESMLLYMEECFQGIHGTVIDTEGKPLSASVTIPDHDIDNSFVVTDPDVGDYHRLLSPGTYTLTVEAEGYKAQTVENIEVTEDQSITVNFILENEEVVSIDVPRENTISAFTVYQNYPNPFNPVTIIPFHLSKKTHISLEIYNTEGQQIRTLISGVKAPGAYECSWDGTDGSGKPVSSGIYFGTITDGYHRSTIKLLLLR